MGGLKKDPPLAFESSSFFFQMSPSQVAWEPDGERLLTYSACYKSVGGQMRPMGRPTVFGISDFKKTAFYQNGKMGRLSYRRERIHFSILNVCLALLSFFPEMHLFGRNGPREYVEYTL